MNLMFVNPITEQNSFLVVDYPKVDYMYWRSCIDVKNDNDIITILNDKLKDLDCTKEYSCGRPMMINYSSYTSTISNYCYYLYKLTNQIIYNTYINKLIDRHIKNIVFEYEYPYVPPVSKKKSTTKKKKLPPNKFFKQVTHDLFTGKEKYNYINPRTKEEINSDNPNMLDELNAPKKKERKKSIKIKEVGVSISAMTFSFKKK